MSEAKYKRVVLKLSGESLAGNQSFGIEGSRLNDTAQEIADIHALGVSIAIVVGGGNIWRGIQGSAKGIERTTSDYMGMLATTMNALALQSFLEAAGVPTRVQSAIDMRQMAEPYIRRRAIRHLEKGRVVIFAAGIGNPYFSTDTTAALRAAEIEADIMLKATNTDGVYNCDPRSNPDAVMYKEVDYQEVLRLGLGVMDSTATSLCMENHIPIIVFNMNKPGNIKRVICGEDIGTHVRG